MVIMIANYFLKLCTKFDVVLNVNQTNKTNQNRLLIALESTNIVFNFDEKTRELSSSVRSAATCNGSGGLRVNVSVSIPSPLKSDHFLRVIELFNDYNIKKDGSRFDVNIICGISANSLLHMVCQRLTNDQSFIDHTINQCQWVINNQKKTQDASLLVAIEHSQTAVANEKIYGVMGYNLRRIDLILILLYFFESDSTNNGFNLCKKMN